jgi:roadblock/LC7 domain-containing protein
MRQSIDELSKSVNLPNKTTKKVIQELKLSILLSLHRKNPEEPLELAQDYAETLTDKAEIEKITAAAQKKVAFNLEMNEKVATAYLEITGKKFDPKVHAKNKNLSRFLMGPPGQGKTSAYIVAAKEVCAELGLRFVEHVSDDYIPRQKDFVMVVQECAGENSAITFGGIPKAEEVTDVNGKKISVLKKAVNYRFTVFEHCAGGVLLFDDAANAAQVIQNVLLPVAQFGSFQGMKLSNALVGFTGNLGSLDGTYTTELSSALRTRVIPMFVTDTVKDFSNRAYEYYNDELGDLGIINFLHRNEKDFSVLPDPGEKSGFACPRSWDNLIQSIRSVVESNGGRGVGEADSLEEIYSLSNSMVGPDIGHKLVAYFHSMMRGADPLARQFVQMNQPDNETLKKRYSNGASPEDISFGYQFATACGDYAVNYIAANDPEKDLEEGIKRFATAVLQLNDSEFAYSLEHLKNKLASHVTDFAQPTKDGRELTGPIRKRIAHAINTNPDCGPGKRDILIKVITDYDKMQTSTAPGKRVGAGRRAMS